MSACHVLAKAQCNSQPLHCVESNACESLIGNHRRQILVESLVPNSFGKGATNQSANFGHHHHYAYAAKWSGDVPMHCLLRASLIPLHEGSVVLCNADPA